MGGTWPWHALSRRRTILGQVVPKTSRILRPSVAAAISCHRGSGTVTSALGPGGCDPTSSLAPLSRRAVSPRIPSLPSSRPRPACPSGPARPRHPRAILRKSECRPDWDRPARSARVRSTGRRLVTPAERPAGHLRSGRPGCEAGSALARPASSGSVLKCT